MDSAEALSELMERAVVSGQRDPSIPEGTILGETDIQGQQVRWKKQRSMVHNGNTALPERFEAYDKFGNQRMLPTAQMARMLSKPRADSPNERAFHTHPRGMTRSTCQICPEPRTPIEQVCEFCLDSTGGRLRKSFYSEADAYAHKTRLHPDEFTALERSTDRAQRQAEIESQQRLAEAMMEMARANTAAAPKPSLAKGA